MQYEILVKEDGVALTLHAKNRNEYVKLHDNVACNLVDGPSQFVGDVFMSWERSPFGTTLSGTFKPTEQDRHHFSATNKIDALQTELRSVEAKRADLEVQRDQLEAKLKAIRQLTI